MLYGDCFLCAQTVAFAVRAWYASAKDRQNGGRSMVGVFLSAMAIGISGAVMPGPLLTYTIRQAFAGGLRSGLTIILGHALLELLLITLIFLGFDLLLQSPVTQTVIGLVGGALLAWMGVGMILDAWHDRLQVQADGAGSARGMVTSGFFISAMNPYFLLWWAIIGLGFLLSAYRSFGFLGAGIWFAGHIATDFLWYGFIAWLIGRTRRFLNPTFYRWLVGVLGAMLLYFGGSFLIGAVQSLL